MEEYAAELEAEKVEALDERRYRPGRSRRQLWLRRERIQRRPDRGRGGELATQKGVLSVQRD